MAEHMKTLNSQLRVTIPLRVHQEFKIRCTREKRTMRETLILLLENYTRRGKGLTLLDLALLENKRKAEERAIMDEARDLTETMPCGKIQCEGCEDYALRTYYKGRKYWGIMECANGFDIDEEKFEIDPKRSHHKFEPYDAPDYERG